ncbi:Lysophospholipase L1 [Actinacidiphila alni]|uniref:Lysophospholipase L1 n=1 Tax=Actinacidiphila alni TaxID=380248 RepID=A0A1I2JQK6_9ACTN|nr:Lysophospholipase L1 [Actinacidiphila alni]
MTPTVGSAGDGSFPAGARPHGGASCAAEVAPGGHGPFGLGNRPTGELRFAVLGDSVSEGVGDPLPGGGWRGWAALLAEGLAARPEGTRLLNLARSGARSGDVAGPQLEAALRHRPDLASVLVGGNDTLRGGFDIRTVAAELHLVMGTLRAEGTELLTACLPDPGTVLGLPWPLARPLGRRMSALNDTVHALSAHHGAHHIHVAAHHWATMPGALSADRLHPSETGHRLLARDFHALLAAAGLAQGAAPRPEPDGAPPGRAASLWWMATQGTRWIADRCTDLLPDLLRLAATEVRHHRRGSTPVLEEDARRATVAALAALKVAPSPVARQPAGQRVLTGTKRTGVPGGDWAAAGSEPSGTTPMTG